MPAILGPRRALFKKRGAAVLLYSARVQKIFSFEDARALLPEVKRLTGEAQRRIEGLRAGTDPEGRGGSPEARVQEILSGWAQALHDHGLEVKGAWLVDFDNGAGYYCWQWPEESLEYYHSYEDGFRGRMRIH